jgi:SAM-dependent methyltransferase
MSIGNIVGKIKKHGIPGSSKIALRLTAAKVRNTYYRWAVRNAPKHSDATMLELAKIESDLNAAGIMVHDYAPRVEDFAAFQAANYFPSNYHGGVGGQVWDEKLLEHWIAAERLGLMHYRPNDIYVDLAAGGSPWAKVMRERLGISAFAIDLKIVPVYQDLAFYRAENATATSFADVSVNGVSLQCAFEMFMRDDDTNLLKELARILKPGGKAVIVPLYMHTHYYAYTTPEHYGKGRSDPLATEYVCCDWNGIPSARFYDVNQLKKRVLDPIKNLGMEYQLLALINKTALGKGIYCHFILEITK